MSILIKGMGMPDSCFHCKLAEVCQHYKAEHYANKRHEDCPLEEVPETHDKHTETHACDLISRQAAIEVIDAVFPVDPMKSEYTQGIACGAALAKTYVEQLPSAQLEKVDTPTVDTPTCEDAVSRQAVKEWLAKWEGYIDADIIAQMQYRIIDIPSEQPERCEYYALCRHGRDENKLRSALGCCDYCTEDSDGYVKPIEKNSHAFIHFGMDGWELNLHAKGWHGSAKIMYCPMCGRRLERG